VSALPTATILVIAYRMQATIADALRSALAQTVPCEIIVSDDSGGDATLDIARELLRDYAGPHRVTVRSTPRNLGLCLHLTELASIATGDILVCLAGDDVAYPQRTQRLLEHFAVHPTSTRTATPWNAMRAARRRKSTSTGCCTGASSRPCSAHRWASAARS
jgi:glycosyltransferase involved in cell wall biosynthesis